MLRTVLPRSEFYRNVLTVMSGTILAQVLPIVASPILSRMFDPADFGVYYVFASAASILAILSTGKYDQAVMLAEEDSDAANVGALSMLLAFFFSLLLFILVLVFHSLIGTWIGSEQYANWFYLLPVSVFLLGSVQAISMWSIRKKYFKTVSVTKVAEEVSNNGAKIAGGILKMATGGLILSNIVCQITSFIPPLITIFKSDKGIAKLVSIASMKAQAKRYRNFPLYMTWGGLFNTSSFLLPNILLTGILSTTWVGWFGFCQRIIRLPVAIIGVAFGEVFRQKVVEEINSKGNCHELFLKTLRALVLIAVVPFSALLLFGPEIFSFTFGVAWEGAGKLAQLFSFPFFLLFCFGPMFPIFLSTGHTQLYFSLQAFMITSIALCIILGGMFLEEKEIIFDLLAAVYTLIHLLIGFFLYRISSMKITTVG